MVNTVRFDQWTEHGKVNRLDERAGGRISRHLDTLLYRADFTEVCTIAKVNEG